MPCSSLPVWLPHTPWLSCPSSTLRKGGATSWAELRTCRRSPRYSHARRGSSRPPRSGYEPRTRRRSYQLLLLRAREPPQRVAAPAGFELARPAPEGRTASGGGRSQTTDLRVCSPSLPGHVLGYAPLLGHPFPSPTPSCWPFSSSRWPGPGCMRAARGAGALRRPGRRRRAWTLIRLRERPYSGLACLGLTCGGAPRPIAERRAGDPPLSKPGEWLPTSTRSHRSFSGPPCSWSTTAIGTSTHAPVPRFRPPTRSGRAPPSRLGTRGPAAEVTAASPAAAARRSSARWPVSPETAGRDPRGGSPGPR
jgi:hypothetical protein